MLCPPKTRRSARLVALDHATAGLLRRHRAAQAAEGAASGGFVFTNARSDPVAPDQLTRQFAALVRRSGQPPIRLHDLRHGAATLSLAAGNDLKAVQAMLGHSSIMLTADTYTSVLPTLAFQAAESTARLVLQAQARTTRKVQRARRRANTPHRLAPTVQIPAQRRAIEAGPHTGPTQDHQWSSEIKTRAHP